MQNPEFSLAHTTALILAGGRGSRMGGVDKGLQLFRGNTLVQTALQRLTMQTSGPLHSVLINANRNTPEYAALGQRVLGPGKVQVFADTLDDFAGPLAGFLVGLQHCTTAFMLTVPCDSPLFPLDLAERLLAALARENADIAMVTAPEPDKDGVLQPRSQPVFCLMRTSLRDRLANFLQQGGRKIDVWTALQHLVLVPFDAPTDDPQAFANANTLDELRHLETEINPDTAG